MRTNINIDEKLLAAAFHYAPVSTKKDMIHLALREYVSQHRRLKLSELKGKIVFEKDYDYKKSRRSE